MGVLLLLVLLVLLLLGREVGVLGEVLWGGLLLLRRYLGVCLCVGLRLRMC